MCDEVFELPYLSEYLFVRVHDFPCANYTKSGKWQFLIGFKNLPVENIHNFRKFS
jgi:hypothetical protein